MQYRRVCKSRACFQNEFQADGLFWVRKNSTVKGLSSEWRRYVRTSEVLGKNTAKSCLDRRNIYHNTGETQFRKNRHRQAGKYMESIRHNLSLETKKKLYLYANMWRLWKCNISGMRSQVNKKGSRVEKEL